MLSNAALRCSSELCRSDYIGPPLKCYPDRIFSQVIQGAHTVVSSLIPPESSGPACAAQYLQKVEIARWIDTISSRSLDLTVNPSSDHLAVVDARKTPAPVSQFLPTRFVIDEPRFVSSHSPAAKSRLGFLWPPDHASQRASISARRFELPKKTTNRPAIAAHLMRSAECRRPSDSLSPSVEDSGVVVHS